MRLCLEISAWLRSSVARVGGWGSGGPPTRSALQLSSATNQPWDLGHVTLTSAVWLQSSTSLLCGGSFRSSYTNVPMPHYPSGQPRGRSIYVGAYQSLCSKVSIIQVHRELTLYTSISWACTPCLLCSELWARQTRSWVGFSGNSDHRTEWSPKNCEGKRRKEQKSSDALKGK